MTEAIRRALRGAAQFGLAEAFIQLALAFGVGLTEAQHVAILGVVTPLVTILHNIVENNVPAIDTRGLPTPASAGQKAQAKKRR